MNDTVIYWSGGDDYPTLIDSASPAVKQEILDGFDKTRKQFDQRDLTWMWVFGLAFVLVFIIVAVYSQKQQKRKA